MLKRLSLFLIAIVYFISGGLTVLPQVQAGKAVPKTACCANLNCQCCQTSGICCCSPQLNQKESSLFAQKVIGKGEGNMVLKQAPCGTTPVQEMTIPSLRRHLPNDAEHFYQTKGLYFQTKNLKFKSQHSPYPAEKPPEVSSLL